MGGWDSRLVLGGASKLKEASLHCLTYGPATNHEPAIARRCAEIAGAQHQCFTIEQKYFPCREAFEDLVRQTEAANFLVWNAIIDAMPNSPEERPLLLLGDHCESIDGRIVIAHLPVAIVLSVEGGP